MTFLFTDIQDSTRLWDESPADMAAAVQIHDAILRNAIDRHDGYVFARGGDGFAAAFATPAGAATAAIESQRELGADPNVRFTVRMGLHTGEAVERDRSYVGSEVNRTARLMALGHGGQILVSDTTAVMLRSRLTLRALGEHVVRGLRGRIAVFQVVADGLPSEFPVLRSVDDFVGNLPQQLSSLVGREQLVTDVAELVRSDRLVTVCGVGGVGKTRLSLEVGAELASEFPDGVWIVELAAVGDGSAVPAAIATVMGITPQGDVPLLDTVAEALAGRRMLLLLDNCEHVLGDATRAVEAMLGRAGNLRIVATSREPLGLAGEMGVTVSPLTVDGGMTSDAVTLFVDRARAVRPNFEVQDPTDAAAVTEICEAVDGLPLGIELAAARMAAMSAVEVRDRLADRFRLLRGTTPGPERQLTLRHAVEWSYDLLSESERALLRTISVFAGGFDLASIGAVAESGDEIEVLQTLDSLVRKSLVIADLSAPRTRYGMFETIRQFAVDRLTDNGDAEATRDRHAAFFAHQAAAHWDHWNGPRWREAVDWVEVELGNLRSAFRWAAARNHVEVGTDIAAHAALMGFSVQLFETAVVGRGTDRCRSGRRRAASAPPLHGRRLRLLRRPPRRRSSERPSRHRARGRRRLRPVRAGLLDVHRSPLPGLLRRPRALRRADRRGGPALWRDAGVRPGVVRRRAPVGGTGRGGTGAHRAIGRRRSRPRQPVLDLVRALDRRHGVLPGRRAAGPGGVGRRRGLRAGAPGPVLRGVPGARRGATAHVRR